EALREIFRLEERSERARRGIERLRTRAVPLVAADARRARAAGEAAGDEHASVGQTRVRRVPLAAARLRFAGEELLAVVRAAERAGLESVGEELDRRLFAIGEREMHLAEALFDLLITLTEEEVARAAREEHRGLVAERDRHVSRAVENALPRRTRGHVLG